MKLKDHDIQPAVAGLPAARREWWDIGNSYEIYVEIADDSCGIGVHAPDKSITYEVAGYLGVDTKVENMSFDAKGRELYLSPSIDCVVLNYMKPERYKELLKKIELIVNEHFKKED